jgi:S1-C subfamily serine protease
MIRMDRVAAWMIALALVGAGGASAVAQEPSTAPSTEPDQTNTAPSTQPAETNTVRAMYDLARPSLVVVKYTFSSEFGMRDLTAAGIVVRDDGLVMIPIWSVLPQMVPDNQMKNFKIILPSDTEDETEIDATLQGRDERSSVAFIRTDSPQKWKAMKFVDAPVQIGQTLYSVGLLPKNAGYKAHVTTVHVSTRLRGPVPQVLVDGNLAGAGAVVLNENGEGIGYVHPTRLGEFFLDSLENPEAIPMINSPPHMFIPTIDFLQSLNDPPTPERPLVLPWFGCMQLKGLEKEEAEYYGLKNQPAIQIGDVVKDSPADKAGLKALDIIVKMNGQPLERGDLPAELPEIVERKVHRLKVGDVITFSIIHARGDTPREVMLTLAARPAEAWAAHRYYAKDLGFVVRDVVFLDTYNRKISPTTTGVVVALLRPQAAAQAAHLAENDLVTQMNGKPVTDLDQFKKDYQQFRKDRPRDPVVLEASRSDGREETINIEPPQTSAAPGGDQTPP